MIDSEKFEGTVMNQNLEKAVSIARSLSEPDQEALGQKFLRIIEERYIDARLVEAEASGDPVPLDDAKAKLERKIAAHKNARKDS